jgi:glycosyltransferase involved in cell wall biosynthesis
MTFDVSVIIPAYNDEKRLPPTLKKVISFLQAQPFTSEILVVTDGSKDRTAEVAEAFKSDFPSLRVLTYSHNRGKGFGVKEGMLAATGKQRLFMDADYAVPVDYLTPFLATMAEGYDIVIGSRGLPDSIISTPQGFPRRQFALLFGQLQYLVLRLPYPDTQCGFKLFTGTAAERFFPLVTYDCAYFDAELLYIAHKSGAKIKQLPVTWQHDNETRLPVGFKRSFELFLKMLKIPSLHGK